MTNKNNPLVYGRACYRLALLAVLILLGIILTILIQFAIRLHVLADGTHVRVASWWHRRVLGILNFKITCIGEIPEHAHLIVCNHISWIDVMVLGGVFPIHFVSKAEVRQWPVIGWLAEKAGTLFIQRGAHATQQIVDALHTHLDQQQFVGLFPEGTTGRGDSVKNFHPRLFAAAISAQAPVLPITLIYEAQPLPHPLVPYVDDDVLFTNLFNLCKASHVNVQLHIHPPIQLENLQRKEIAATAHSLISGAIENYMSNNR